jgi:hypothetical protein
LPKYLEFNLLGNLHHPEWGETNTWEWFEDEIKGGDRLDGGNSSYGGLAGVGDSFPAYSNDGFGFRPLVMLE